jgi:DNA-binding Lrp family transcriptional regulator
LPLAGIRELIGSEAGEQVPVQRERRQGHHDGRAGGGVRSHPYWQSRPISWMPRSGTSEGTAKSGKYGRLSGRDLAERIGLSLTPTLRRLRRLEKERYIPGYVAQLDEQRLAGSMTVFVAVTLEKQPAIAGFERAITQCPEVMSCFLTTGDADYSLRVVVRDLSAYHHFLTAQEVPA